MQHEMISVDETMQDVRLVLMNLERDLISIMKQKTKMLGQSEKHIEHINEQKIVFLEEQKKKIEELKTYLDNKYDQITCEYNKAIEKDVVNTKNYISKLFSEISDNKEFIQSTQVLREKLEFNEGPNLIENIIKTG
jgi:hypothetical protein